jgi:hypothetical protein
MNKGEEEKKKEWRKPAYESLKFSQTLIGNKPNWSESVTHGPNIGGSMGS